ncbi:hypothetical protein [Williamsia phyllosphaerae]|uniref:Uncharacterized protein n=1 Tax=Williamsia phyllosphaerae TaxID=885042 RepID=A0ABQ1V8P0_9NOCA|nr:hypothetical protein [Williamsia phyllosphaerae]GGF44340.1 hypothetical protein GCM10007298_45110 [Williamsia phyllosphaerae]
MNQPIPGPRPGPPTPSPVVERSAIDPSQIQRDVREYTAQVDEVRRAAQDRHDLGGDTEPGADLSTLDTQAELLERAHDVLTATLEQLDRV